MKAKRVVEMTLTKEQSEMLQEVLSDWRSKRESEKHAEKYWLMNGFHSELVNSGEWASTYRVSKDSYHAYFTINHATGENRIFQMYLFSAMWPHIKRGGA